MLGGSSNSGCSPFPEIYTMRTHQHQLIASRCACGFRASSAPFLSPTRWREGAPQAQVGAQAITCAINKNLATCIGARVCPVRIWYHVQGYIYIYISLSLSLYTHTHIYIYICVVCHGCAVSTASRNLETQARFFSSMQIQHSDRE